jgi:integrase/recombinase XerD
MKSTPTSTLSRALRGFFTDYLPRQRAMSPHTVHSYRDSLKLLLQFIAGKRRDSTRLTVEQLGMEHIIAFLTQLESRRHNCASTRNVRLSAIHSFFRYLGSQHPEHLDQAQRVLSIPFKRTSTREIQHLEIAEVQAVLGAIDRSRPPGRRDYALFSLMFNTGGRVGEIVALQACDLRLTAPPNVLLHGKGRKERVCPLWPQTAKLLHALLEERNLPPTQAAAVFVNHRGGPLTRFGVRFILRKHLAGAARRQPSLKAKRLHPHSVRHSTALHLLRSGVDLSTIAHWLGHASVNTTNKYLAMDLETKREALAKAKPLITGPRRPATWREDQDLLKWLEGL